MYNVSRFSEFNDFLDELISELYLTQASEPHYDIDNNRFKCDNIEFDECEHDDCCECCDYEDSNLVYMPGIKKVISKDPATVVFWDDDTKTVVKANHEKFDKEKGLAMAIVKKLCGNKGNYNELFRMWLGDCE